jgi:outer membrane protein OmpA-like peptidoglycan-associated protein
VKDSRSSLEATQQRRIENQSGICEEPMKCRLLLVVLAMLLLPTLQISAQQPSAQQAASPSSIPEASSDVVAYWVAYWAKQPILLFGTEQEAFNSNVREVPFPWNKYDQPLSPDVLDADAQWLKDHATNHFYLEGYASAEGDPGYNLTLSRQRADWVKQSLISKGIPESQILLATGWGQTYPVCAELDDQCLSKNRLVRFVYSPR